MGEFDPYAELGVPRDATTEEVRAAYRDAAKRTHPDAGGTAEAFNRARRASVVLTDPIKRKTFDDQGTMDDGPDNKRVGAIGVIERFMAEVITGYINGGMVAAMDPRHRNLVEEFMAVVASELGDMEVHELNMKKALKFLQDMRDRFECQDVTDPIGRGLDRQISNVNAQIETIKNGRELRRIALEIISSYKFRHDPQDAAAKIDGSIPYFFHLNLAAGYRP